MTDKMIDSGAPVTVTFVGRHSGREHKAHFDLGTAKENSLQALRHAHQMDSLIVACEPRAR